MANFLNGFLDNLLTGVLTPKGDMGDYRHAAYLYNTDGHRLSPKVKFLYHVVFEPSPAAIRFMPSISNNHRTEINMLVKEVELPRFQANVETKNQYNRKKNIQTSINYSPIRITLHDDNFGLTTALMEAYYRYYFKDGNHQADGMSAPYNPRSTYRGEELARYRYGLDNDSYLPFFSRITVYQLARHAYTGFTLVNPLIENWGHDTLNNSISEAVSNQMTINYEAVFYTRGAVRNGDPQGFGTSHYDQTPSPLSIAGGGTVSVFGSGGFVDGVSGILGDITSGNFGLGSIISGVNLFNNSGKLTFDGLLEEGTSILSGSLGNVLTGSPGGINNTVFPVTNSTSQIINTTGGTSNASDPVYAARIAQAQTLAGRQ